MIVTIALGASLAAFGIGNRPSRSPELPPASALQAQEPEKAEHNRTVVLEVRSAAENKPLADAAVWVRVRGGRSGGPIVGCTNKLGQYTIDLTGQTILSVDIVAAADGHVPKQIRWVGENLPDNFVLSLERGHRIGGKVVDEQGRPIAGARVLPGFEVWGGEEVTAAVTDALGVWHLDVMPSSAHGSKPARPIDLLVSHPDHVATSMRVPAVAANAGTAVLTMKQGAAIDGSIVGPDGQPVAGASVVVEPEDQPLLSFNRTVTDASGQFHFGRLVNPQGRSIALTVKAPGLAVTVRRILVTASIPRQTIRLTPSVPLRGRVIDSQGKPVAGASLRSSLHDTKGLDWCAFSDAQGRFEWPDAPTSGLIRLDVDKPTCAEALDRIFEAGNREITITLHRPLYLHGTVTDAVTGQPIERFNVIPGWGPIVPGGAVQWRTGLGDAHHVGGRFDLRGLFTDQGAASRCGSRPRVIYLPS